jgi:hypothetical protein
MFNRSLKWGRYESKNPASTPEMLREVHPRQTPVPRRDPGASRAMATDKNKTAASVLAEPRCLAPPTRGNHFSQVSS